METQKHSPKLRIVGETIQFLQIQMPDGSWAHFEDSTLEQDKFIVRACNAYDKLVECLRRIENEAGKGLDEGDSRSALIDIKHNARKALAEAEAAHG